MTKAKIKNDYIKGTRRPLVHWEDLSVDTKNIDKILRKYINKNFLRKENLYE